MAGRHCSKQEVEGVCIFHSKHEAEGSRNDVRLSGMRGEYYFLLLCVGVLPACLSVHHMLSVPKEARRSHWNPAPGLELEIVESHHMGAGNQIWLH